MPTITIGRLHKILGALVEKGHARKPVCVQKDSFWGPLESDGIVIFDVTEAEFIAVLQGDDDGGTQMNRDGTERTRHSLVLRGGMKCPSHDGCTSHTGRIAVASEAGAAANPPTFPRPASDFTGRPSETPSENA